VFLLYDRISTERFPYYILMYSVDQGCQTYAMRAQSGTRHSLLSQFVLRTTLCYIINIYI